MNDSTPLSGAQRGRVAALGVKLSNRGGWLVLVGILLLVWSPAWLFPNGAWVVIAVGIGLTAAALTVWVFQHDEIQREIDRAMTWSGEGTRALLEEVLVEAFAPRMTAKLAAAREKGRGGWHDPNDCTVEHLWDCLSEHVRKDNLDMVDVANIAAMIDWRLHNVPGDRERLAAYVAPQYGVMPSRLQVPWVKVIVTHQGGRERVVEILPEVEP